MALLAVVGLVIALWARRRRTRGERPGGPHQMLPAVLGGVLALATNIFYLWLVFYQGGPVDVAPVAVVASVIVLAAALAFVGAVAIRPALARTSLIAATSLLLVMGVLGMFSIGLPLFVAGLLTLVNAAGAGRRQPTRKPQRP